MRVWIGPSFSDGLSFGLYAGGALVGVVRAVHDGYAVEFWYDRHRRAFGDCRAPSLAALRAKLDA